MSSEDFYAKYIGQVYERLTILSVVRDPKPKFVCACSCGNETITDVHSVLTGKTRSCRCIQKELIRERGKENLKPAVQIGEIFKNKKGLEFGVIEYQKSHSVKVKFINSGFEVWSAVKEIKKGSIRDWIATPLQPKAVYVSNGRKRKEAVVKGQVIENFYGCKFEVIEILDNAMCRIKFLDEFAYEKVVPRSSARKGVRNPFRRLASGIGYVGVGEYSPDADRRLYTLWNNVFTRCYDEVQLKKGVTYVGCSICEEWHNFQNFAKWCDDQPQYSNGNVWCLDKDIIFKGNKVYSPETCCFVPTELNNLFTLRGNARGIYPLGVYFNKKDEKFIAQVNINGKRTTLGRYISVDTAFTAYKIAKEKIIKDAANRYKDQLDQRTYTALINWKVEVTD